MQVAADKLCINFIDPLLELVMHDGARWSFSRVLYALRCFFILNEPHNKVMLPIVPYQDRVCSWISVGAWFLRHHT